MCGCFDSLGFDTKLKQEELIRIELVHGGSKMVGKSARLIYNVGGHAGVVRS